MQKFSIIAGGGQRLAFEGRSLTRATTDATTVEVWQKADKSFVTQIIVHPSAAGETVKYQAGEFADQDDAVAFFATAGEQLQALVRAYFNSPPVTPT